MVALVKHDLEFILKQIEIAEAHAAGGDLAKLVAGYNGNDGLTQAHLLPYGLRTVDGSYNNLLPGRENWGASDQSFPGLFTPTYINEADGDRYDFNPAPNAETWYTNNNYAYAGTRSGSQPGPGSGTVIDADPRIISNLVVDQTLDNPAAIAAALTHAGMSGQPLMTALSEIANAHTVLKAIPAPSAGQQPSAAYTLAEAALDAKLAQYGVEMDGNSVFLPNVSPDEGLSSPFNGWMTIFGQFFDHGLDLVAKGGNGTVYVPLSPDDPMYSTAPGAQNYIPLTRVTVNAGADGILGTADDGAGPKNLTTPWVDQNQTYASTASKQVFMREYVPGPDGKPIASGHLLEGSNGGLATWADIKAQAKTVLGIELTDLNVGNIPLIAADQYGNFIPGPNGYPQLVVGMGPDGKLGTADDVLREGNPAAPVSAQGVVLTGHAFLDDIAHAAVPITATVDGVVVLQADTDTALGYANADGTPGPQGQRGPSAYDNELLDRHFVAGDGRANENIALTAVHQVFHSEHNRVVEMTKNIALTSGDLNFLNEWLLVDVTAIPTTEAGKAALVWDGERLFQAGRFTNEMEYQHLVFEEFGRMMQPDIDAFVFEPSADINPSIAAEFAHVVYRFGHSMLRQDIAIIEMGPDGKPVQSDVKLFDGFLNPVMYDSLGDAEAASGAIIRGMSRQTGSEIDEFVT
ncbi:peroxidase family protein, partial [Methylobacterium soli]